VTECKRLISLVEIAGLQIVNEPRETELVDYPGSFATFPLHIADRFGTWCPEFPQLLKLVYSVYEESVLQFQSPNETPEAREKTRLGVQSFLFCFSLGKVNVPHSYLACPAHRPPKIAKHRK
jgi:hypothetical protein